MCHVFLHTYYDYSTIQLLTISLFISYIMLHQLKVVATTESTLATNMDPFGGSTRTASSSTDIECEKSDENAFRSVMNEMKRDNLFGEVETAALRLAAVRKDPMLTDALSDFRDGSMDDTLFKSTLLHVCERVIQVSYVMCVKQYMIVLADVKAQDFFLPPSVFGGM